MYEDLATSVNLKLFDFRLVNRLQGIIIVRAWELFKPWIVARRNAYTAPSLYCEIEMLASRIQKARTKAGSPIEIV